ncbi:MAG: transporter substrate-binding domain-containing protein [Bacteriovorax sp.]|jgi:ABC-type amino acid transport substrate-binding protein
MKNLFILLLVCASCTLYSAADALGAEIKIATSNVAPFASLDNGELKGIYIDLFRHLEKESGLKFKIDLYPHARLVLALEEESPDLLIIFKPICNKYQEYEVQGKALHSLRPSIYLKKSVDQSRQNFRIGKLTGTCTELIKNYVKKEFAFDVSTMDQAIEMLKSDRIDGICGLSLVVNHSISKNKAFKEKLVVYKTVPEGNKYDAVLCRKKNLSPRTKRKLEDGLKKIKYPDIH